MNKYIVDMIQSRKEYLENKIKGKEETIRLYAQEIANAEFKIQEYKKELNKIEEVEKECSEL